MSSCKEEDDGDREARDSVEGSTAEEKEGLFYFYTHTSFFFAIVDNHNHS